jgi:hypothetical protein
MLAPAVAVESPDCVAPNFLGNRNDLCPATGQEIAHRSLGVVDRHIAGSRQPENGLVDC